MLLSIGLRAQDFEQINALGLTYDKANEKANAIGFYKGHNTENGLYFEGYAATGYGTVKYFYRTETKNGILIKGECFMMKVNTNTTLKINNKYSVVTKVNLKYGYTEYIIKEVKK